MKVLHIGKQDMMKKYSAPDSILWELDSVDLPIGLTATEYLERGGDADFIVADAIAVISAELIEGMPKLKLIHSEGVAFNGIDTVAADHCGVFVCNSQGMNASAVAEQTILLMLGMLRNVVANDAAVREGRQIDVKEGYMQRGDLKELADCSVGLVGFGDIGRMTARLLSAHGVKTIYYYKRAPLPKDAEDEYGVSYRPIRELLADSDIVSLHLPVTADTERMANDAFFAGMKNGSYFVNTSRGALVDDHALIDALSSGKIAMAGLDTINSEPVKIDHPLLKAPAVAEKILFSPHIGGITAASFRRSYAMISDDIRAVIEGRNPARVVNTGPDI